MSVLQDTTFFRYLTSYRYSNVDEVLSGKLTGYLARTVFKLFKRVCKSLVA